MKGDFLMSIKGLLDFQLKSYPLDNVDYPLGTLELKNENVVIFVIKVFQPYKIDNTID